MILVIDQPQSFDKDQQVSWIFVVRRNMTQHFTKVLFQAQLREERRLRQLAEAALVSVVVFNEWQVWQVSENGAFSQSSAFFPSEGFLFSFGGLGVDLCSLECRVWSAGCV